MFFFSLVKFHSFFATLVLIEFYILYQNITETLITLLLARGNGDCDFAISVIY